MNLGVRLATVVLLVGVAPAASAQGSVRAAPSEPSTAVPSQGTVREPAPLDVSLSRVDR